MLLHEVVTASREVAETSSRLAKRDLLAALLRRLDHSSANEIEIASAYLSGVLRQRRTGVGWRSLAGLPAPSDGSSLTLLELDAALQALSELAGPGSATRRKLAIADLFSRLTEDEQRFVQALLTGNVRQGALDAVLLEAIAAAAEVPPTVVRRAAMFSALTGPIAAAALVTGERALREFTMVPGRPVRPMLAGGAPDIAAAVDRIGGEFVVDTKLDGIRIQVHKVDDSVSVFTRSLEEISERFPALVGEVRRLDGDLVLDGEALGVSDDGRPLPFQDTASNTARHDGTSSSVRAFFFDLLVHGHDSLVDLPLATRLRHLDVVVPETMRVLRQESSDAGAAQRFFDDAVAAGQEGVILKRLDAPYAAGRRGSAWVKVKPRHTLDLVVLAVEWGSGRRQGTLSNIHLGARSGDGFIMLGKTFKGMTDQMLAWQTERFLSLETHREGHVVHLRPEQVVEIAFDGVQRSTRYPGGVALRFARVLRYRDDKPAGESDSLASVRALSRT